MDIKCRKLTCEYNDNWVCKAKAIDITSKTVCETFVAIEKEVKDNTKDMFTIAPIYENYRHIKDVKLGCNAKCFFNKNGECMSNGITVLCGTTKPICGTFLKK